MKSNLQICKQKPRLLKAGLVRGGAGGYLRRFQGRGLETNARNDALFTCQSRPNFSALTYPRRMANMMPRRVISRQPGRRDNSAASAVVIMVIFSPFLFSSIIPQGAKRLAIL